MAQFSRVMVVWNVVSGADTQPKDRKAVEGFLDEAGVEYRLREWRSADDPARFVREAADGDFDLVLAAGGDGTAAAVADALIRQRRDLPLAALPLGTSNLLAASLGVPDGARDALEALWAGQIRRVDAGYMPGRDRYFLLAASAGAHAEMLRRTSRRLKRDLGFFAYLISAVRTILGFHLRKADIEADGTRHSWRTDSVMVLNMAGFLQVEDALAHRVDPADGKLDLVVTRKGSLLDLAGLLLSALIGRRFDPWRTEHRHVRRVTVAAAEGLEVQSDGEPAGSSPMTAEVVEAALNVVVCPRSG